MLRVGLAEVGIVVATLEFQMKDDIVVTDEFHARAAECSLEHHVGLLGVADAMLAIEVFGEAERVLWERARC